MFCFIYYHFRFSNISYVNWIGSYNWKHFEYNWSNDSSVSTIWNLTNIVKRSVYSQEEKIVKNSVWEIESCDTASFQSINCIWYVHFWSIILYFSFKFWFWFFTLNSESRVVAFLFSQFYFAQLAKPARANNTNTNTNWKDTGKMPTSAKNRIKKCKSNRRKLKRSEGIFVKSLFLLPFFAVVY